MIKCTGLLLYTLLSKLVFSVLHYFKINASGFHIVLFQFLYEVCLKVAEDRFLLKCSA